MATSEAQAMYDVFVFIGAVVGVGSLAYGAYMVGEGVSVLRNCYKELKGSRKRLDQKNGGLEEKTELVK